MVSAIENVALFAPAIASSGVFAIRRAKRGFDAMDENPFFGTANFIIAGGQTFKGVQAAIAATPSATEYIKTMNGALKGVSTSSKLLKPAAKILRFVSNNINPLICGASAIKVLGADDKADAAVREIFGLGFMFLFENIAKILFGIPKTSINAKGLIESTPVEALLKKIPFFADFAKSFKNYCNNTKLFNKIPLKSIPGALIGLALVGASCFGYQLGRNFACKLLGYEECKTSSHQEQRIKKDTRHVVSVHG